MKEKRPSQRWPGVSRFREGNRPFGNAAVVQINRRMSRATLICTPPAPQRTPRMAMAPSPAGAAGMAVDPAAGADTMAGGAADDMAGTQVLVTICKNADGSYTVYDGDEPDAEVGDMSGDDAAAMGSAPEGGSGGTPADSVGAALKVAMDILQADASAEGAPGSADDQFAAGFSSSKMPTPATGMAKR